MAQTTQYSLDWISVQQKNKLYECYPNYKIFYEI
jgi:hypothetical protein